MGAVLLSSVDARWAGYTNFGGVIHSLTAFGIRGNYVYLVLRG